MGIGLDKTKIDIFNSFAYGSMIEKYTANLNLFNSASNGCIVLKNGSNVGDWSDPNVMWKQIGGLVVDRNVYGDAVTGEKRLEMRSDTMVKYAERTESLRMDNSWMTWIGRNPEEAGRVFGEQVADQRTAAMITKGLGAVGGILAARTYGAVKPMVSTADATGIPTYQELITASAVFGDKFDELKCVVAHSAVWHTMLKNNVDNAQRLFQFGSVIVYTDAMGRPIIISDHPSTGNVTAGFNTFMLSQGAVTIEDNGDFDYVMEKKGGGENITRTYQAEWTNQLGVKGEAWIKTAAAASPTTANLIDPTKWEAQITDVKLCAGVVIKKPAAGRSSK